jgi:hypothetical protein
LNPMDSSVRIGELSFRLLFHDKTKLTCSHPIKYPTIFYEVSCSF